MFAADPAGSWGGGVGGQTAALALERARVVSEEMAEGE